MGEVLQVCHCPHSNETLGAQLSPRSSTSALPFFEFLTKGKIEPTNSPRLSAFTLKSCDSPSDFDTSRKSWFAGYPFPRTIAISNLGDRRIASNVHSLSL